MSAQPVANPKTLYTAHALLRDYSIKFVRIVEVRNGYQRDSDGRLHQRTRLYRSQEDAQANGRRLLDLERQRITHMQERYDRLKASVDAY